MLIIQFLIYRDVRTRFCDCFVHFFKSGALRVAALAAQAIRPFLLLAFLWASFSKEKRLKSFAIKGLLTLFLLQL